MQPALVWHKVTLYIFHDAYAYIYVLQKYILSFKVKAEVKKTFISEFEQIVRKITARSLAAVSQCAAHSTPQKWYFQ